MLMQPITQYDSRIAQMFRNLRGLGIHSILPAAFPTHRRWYLADGGSIVIPSSELVDGDGSILRFNDEMVRATPSSTRVSRADHGVPGVGIRVEPDVTIDGDHDVQPSGSWSLDTAGGPAQIVATENTTDLLAPDGTNTATRFDFDAVDVGAGERSQVAQTADAGNVQISSRMWLRGAAGGEVIYLHLLNSNGTASTSTECILTTRWQLFLVVGASRKFALLGVDSRGTGHQNQPIQTVYAWGGYVDGGGLSFTTSTIIGAAGTIRTADNLQWPNTGEQLVPAAEGTIIVVVNSEFDSADVPGVANIIFIADVTNGIILNAEGSDGMLHWFTRSGGVLTEMISTSGITRGVPIVITITWKAGAARIDINGVTEDSDTPVAAPASIPAIAYFGQNDVGNSFWAGIIGPLLTFKRALTLSQVNSVIHREIAPIYPARLRMVA